MDIRRFFCVQTSTKNSDSNAGSSKKSSEKAAGGKSGKSKETAKRRISKSSESEEDRKHKNKRKKSKVIVETDSEEEPLPTKIRKKDSGRKKNDIRISSDEEDALPQRLQKTAKNEPQKKKPLSKPKAAEVTPAKRVTTASEYFGAKPIERSSKKTQKRKERPQEVSEECAVVESNNNSEPTTNHLSHENELPSEKPSKKAKKCLLEDTAERATKVEDKIDFLPKKSPSLTPKKSKSSQNRKQATSKSETPGKSHNSVSASKEMSKTSNKNKTRKTVTPEKQKAKEMSPKSGNKTTECKQRTSKKNITPEKVTSAKSKLPVPTADDKKATPNEKIATKKDQVNSTPSKNENKHLSEDVVPSSLERKASGYRSFMMREGPQALGSKEIPRGSETCLEGKVFVISGILESIEREDAVDLIKRHGGKVTQAVSKKTSYLVVGRDPGMSKIEKAEKFGTKQIDDDGLFKMIRASQPTATKPDLKEKQSNFNDESSIDLESSQFTEESESQASVDQTQSHGGHSQSSVFSSSACSTPSTKTPISSPLPAGKARDSLLWVDKYKPTSIKDIVGQKGDKGNVKKLLSWLQNWRENNQKSTKPKGGYFAGKEDGSIFKAALLSGPPGVGKTTSAHLVCKEAGFSFVEFNASDSRSKKTLEQQISELLDNKTMDGYFGAAAGKSSGTKHALVMDEVDGMAGNEDRGGMQELINLIKSTKIPIICMCNDRNSQKVRSLANYCFDLRFHRPRVDQLKAAMMSIAFKEQLKVSPQAMEKIVVGANQDVRQVLYNLSMWTSKQKSISYDEAKADADRAHKDIKIGPFDVTRKIFSAEESSKMKIQDQFSLFFNDYSLIPLFSQENYLQVVPYRAGGDLKKTLKCVSDAAESYCHSDLVEKSIRSNGSWNLLPLQAFFSCVYPGAVMRGRMSQRIDFPCWLGNNSTTTKNSRILQDLVSHAQLSISGSKNELNLEYIPHLRNVLSRPLINATSEDCSLKVSEVIDVMDSYHFVKDDWDNIMDVGYYDGKRKLQGDIDSKVKSAFTRTYNKASHLTPYAMNVGAKKTKKSAVDLETEGLGTGDTPEVSDDDSNEEIDQSFKVKKSGKTGGKKSGNAPAGTSSKQARGKGSGKSRDKTKK